MNEQKDIIHQLKPLKPLKLKPFKFVVNLMLILTIPFVIPSQTLATEAQERFKNQNLTGEVLFNNNCNVCHIGGNNIIIPEKNLRKKSLEANGMNNLEAVMYQVTNGKNGMPAFGGRLNETEIEEVAIYVLQEFGRSEKNNEN